MVVDHFSYGFQRGCSCSFDWPGGESWTLSTAFGDWSSPDLPVRVVVNCFPRIEAVNTVGYDHKYWCTIITGYGIFVGEPTGEPSALIIFRFCLSFMLCYQNWG